MNDGCYLIGFDSTIFQRRKENKFEIRFTQAPVVSTDKMDLALEDIFIKWVESGPWRVNMSGSNVMNISSLDYPNTIVFMDGFNMLRDWQSKYFDV